MAGSRRPGGTGGIGAVALADLLGRWPAADGPLYRLLATRIARLADTGELPAGLRLPPERDLAAALSVSRNTVAAAYQVLRDEGMAESRQGAGTRIVPHRTTPAAVHRANGFFAGLLENSVLDADLTLAAVDCAPQVAAALADPAAVLGGTESVTATSGYFPLGLPALRAAIASHLTERLGLPADPAEVIVTTGGQQAMDLLIRCEVLPGQPVVVEDPTFPGALDALYRAGARVIGIPAGTGLDPDRLEHVVRTHRPAMVYLIPTHHNPTGLVMPAGHRRRVARLAAAHPDTLFVDDMTHGRTAARRQPAPAPAGRPCPPAAEPGQRRLAVQALLGRPADRLGPGQRGPDRPGSGGQGRGRPGQRRLPAGDRGRAAGRRARRHRQVAPGVAAGQARRTVRSLAQAPARVDVARTGRRPHPLGAPSGRQRRVRPGRAQARGRRGARPPAERQRRGGQPAAGPARRANTCAWRSPSRRTSWPDPPWPWPGPAAAIGAQAVLRPGRSRSGRSW